MLVIWIEWESELGAWVVLEGVDLDVVSDMVKDN